MNKVDLRKKMLQQLRLQNENEKKYSEEKIYNKLFTSKEWNDATRIFITISLPHEVDTNPIVSRAWEEGKETIVPLTIHEKKLLEFRIISSFTQLREGKFGLKEPILSSTIQTSLFDSPAHSLLIVPGIVFDKRGFRIGYGGGYYDRLLAKAEPKLMILSLLFDFQLLESLPIEEHDLPVKKLITSEKTIEIE